jgi:DNA-binding transcriptional regulator YiaG
MNATTRKNLAAIFGVDFDGGSGIYSRDCTITGRIKRPIPGQMQVYCHNLKELWIFTKQPKRFTQDVVARIDLSDPKAMSRLVEVGVVLQRRTMLNHEFMKSRRIILKLTQHEAAINAGMSTAIWSAYEQGRQRNPTANKLLAIARALDVAVDELLMPRIIENQN